MATPASDLSKVELMASAWGRLRPEKSFCGISLEHLNALVKASVDARAVVSDLRGRKLAAHKNRISADAALRAAVRKVIRGVQGDAEDGEDSELYGAMGFVPLSQRRPRRRLKKNAETPTA